MLCGALVRFLPKVSQWLRTTLKQLHLLLDGKTGLVHHRLSLLQINLLVGLAEVARDRLPSNFTPSEVIQICEVLLTANLLFLLNCLFFGLSGNSIFLLLNYKLVDPALVYL